MPQEGRSPHRVVVQGRKVAYMTNRILVPLDGSPDMAEIIPTLRRLVAGTGAIVHLLLVRPPVPGPVQGKDRVLFLDELVSVERTAWEGYLGHHGRQLEDANVAVQCEVRFGDALAETLAVGQRQKVQFIALAGQPQRWLQRLLRPNLAQRLLGQQRAPVLIV
jgi:nucleotide-binding universal stress UspA family protein